jgi:hypothetical protein
VDLLAENIYIADTGNNRVVLVKLPADDPLQSWNTMVAFAASGNLEGAISSFSSVTADGYRQTFLSIGISALTTDLNAIGLLHPVFIRSDTAQYYFEQTIDGQLLLFPVDFVKENGVWKIMQF